MPPLYVLLEMDESDQLNTTPEFPALIVCDDGSVGGLSHLDYWTQDVDQWFWSSPGTYLVDVLGRKFEQVGERNDSGRPLAPPTWTFIRQMDLAEIQQLVQPDFPSAAGGVREIVEAVNVIVAR